MKNLFRLGFVSKLALLVIFLCAPSLVSSSEESNLGATANGTLAAPIEQPTETKDEHGDSHGHDHISAILLSLIVILLAAKIGGDLAVRFHQPEVLGELVVGMALGNLSLLGIMMFEFIQTDVVISVLSELGVILLLFEIGLETNLKEMRRVGGTALVVALLGVVAPMVMGYAVSSYFAPNADVLVHVFIGAILAATSVGITARVLKDLGYIQTNEAKIILGAAVIDDVLGLVVLGVISGIITAADKGAELEIFSLSLLVLYAVGFLVLAVFLGSKLSPITFRLANRLRSGGALLVTSLVICFAISYLAAKVGLAPIVGAFAAGLVLEPLHYQKLSQKSGNITIEQLLSPITTLLVPIFFVVMGARVDASHFANAEILSFSIALTIVAIVGKQICSLGVRTPGIDRITVGLGMVPRGEVGLIFAGLGASLTLHGQPVIGPSTFGAVVFMVIVTTMIAPPLLGMRISRIQGKARKP